MNRQPLWSAHSPSYHDSVPISRRVVRLLHGCNWRDLWARGGADCATDPGAQLLLGAVLTWVLFRWLGGSQPMLQEMNRLAVGFETELLEQSGPRLSSLLRQ